MALKLTKKDDGTFENEVARIKKHAPTININALCKDTDEEYGETIVIIDDDFIVFLSQTSP